MLVSQGKPVAEAMRSIAVTEVTYYRWRQEYGGLKGDQVKRLKELEAENTWLPRASDAGSHVTAARRRGAAARLRDLAQQRHRFGYLSADRQLLSIAGRRRLHVLLRRDGEAASRNKIVPGSSPRLREARGLKRRTLIRNRFAILNTLSSLRFFGAKEQVRKSVHCSRPPTTTPCGLTRGAATSHRRRKPPSSP